MSACRLFWRVSENQDVALYLIRHQFLMGLGYLWGLVEYPF